MAIIDINLPINRIGLRGAVQGACLMYGMIWWASRLEMARIKNMLPFFLYVLILTASGVNSTDAMFVLYQVGSLFAVILFAGAYADQHYRIVEKPAFRWYWLWVSGVLAIACVASLIGKFVGFSRAMVFVTGEYRLQGIYDEPATLAGSAGLLVGIAGFGLSKWWMRIVPIAAAFVCLYGAASRTFMIAALAGVIGTGWFYLPQYRLRLVGLAFVGALFAGGWLLTAERSVERAVSFYFRTDSVSTLTGRTAMWHEAMDRFTARPLLGYGFTLGTAAALGGEQHSLSLVAQDSQPKSQQKLHSGYVQSLLDSGALGAAVYIGLLAMALWRMLKYDTARAHPATFYVLCFITVANLAETIIQSASVFRGVIAWTVIVFAHFIPRPQKSVPMMKTSIVT